MSRTLTLWDMVVFTVQQRFSLQLFFSVLIMWITLFFWSPIRAEEYCLTESFHGECAKNELILMEEAQFGRMRLGRCVTRNYGNIGCYAEVLGLMDSACSGRWSCDISVSDSAMVRTKPCPKDFASYLDATYRCVPGVPVIPDFCLASKIQTIFETEGYIPGPVSDPSLDANHPCILLFHLPLGQRLNLTMYDFTSRNATTRSPDVGGGGGGEGIWGGSSETSHLFYEDEESDGHASAFKPCHRYAVVTESDSDDGVSICAGTSRETNVYISRSNWIQLQVFTASSTTALSRSNFLLRFEVIGCPDPVLSNEVYVRHEEGRLLVICNSTGETSILVCSGRTWTGLVRNCTEPTVPGSKSNTEDGYGDFSSLPQVGLSVVITFGVSLIVVIYVAIMAVCIMYIRRRRKRYTPGTEVSEQMTFLDGEDSFQLAISSSSSSSAQRGVFVPRHEHCQLLLCSERGGGSTSSNHDLSPTYSRCAHLSQRLPPSHPPHCSCDRLLSPGNKRIATCACALRWSEGVCHGHRCDVHSQDAFALVGERDFDPRQTAAPAAFGGEYRQQHQQQQQQQQQRVCYGQHYQTPDDLCRCNKDRLRCAAEERCVDFATRLDIRSLGLRECSSVEDAAAAAAATAPLVGYPNKPRCIDRTGQTDQCSLIDCVGSNCRSLDCNRLCTNCNEIQSNLLPPETARGMEKRVGTRAAGVGGWNGERNTGYGGGRADIVQGAARKDDRLAIQSVSRCVGMESSPKEQSKRSAADEDAAAAASVSEAQENAVNEEKKTELSAITSCCSSSSDKRLTPEDARPLANPDVVSVTGTPQLRHGYA